MADEIGKVVLENVFQKIVLPFPVNKVVAQVTNSVGEASQPDKSMTKMMNELFKVPAILSLQSTLQKASDKGSRALIAVCKSKPPTRGSGKGI